MRETGRRGYSPMEEKASLPEADSPKSPKKRSKLARIARTVLMGAMLTHDAFAGGRAQVERQTQGVETQENLDLILEKTQEADKQLAALESKPIDVESLNEEFKHSIRDAELIIEKNESDTSVNESLEKLSKAKIPEVLPKGMLEAAIVLAEIADEMDSIKETIERAQSDLERQVRSTELAGNLTTNDYLDRLVTSYNSVVDFTESAGFQKLTEKDKQALINWKTNFKPRLESVITSASNPRKKNLDDYNILRRKLDGLKTTYLEAIHKAESLKNESNKLQDEIVHRSTPQTIK